MRQAFRDPRFDGVFAACFLLVLAAYLWDVVPALLRGPVEWSALLDWPRLVGLAGIAAAYAMRVWSRVTRDRMNPGAR